MTTMMSFISQTSFLRLPRPTIQMLTISKLLKNMLEPSLLILQSISASHRQMSEAKVVLYQFLSEKTSTSVSQIMTIIAQRTNKRLIATSSALIMTRQILNSTSTEIQSLQSSSQTAVSLPVEQLSISLELGSLSIQCTVSSHSADSEESSSEVDSFQLPEFSAHHHKLDKAMQ
jgi:hypothetical protein